MTPQELQALRAEIESGPLAEELAPAVAVGNHSSSEGTGVADILNRKDVPTFEAIPVGACMKWASAGPYVRIKAFADNDAAPEALRASLGVFLEILAHPRNELVDLHDPEVQAMFEGWLTAKVITQAEYEAIYHAESGRAASLTSRAEILFGREVHHLEVARALKG